LFELFFSYKITAFTYKTYKLMIFSVFFKEIK
jgi:hypothetical protein